LLLFEALIIKQVFACTAIQLPVIIKNRKTTTIYMKTKNLIAFAAGLPG